MPRLWTETIEGHRREVRQAILDTTAALASEHGVLAVTMSQIAEEAGIGRATLYKYFPDVEAILMAWHDRQVTGHLEQLEGLVDRPGSAATRLEAVLEAYALLSRHGNGGHHGELGEFLHRDEQLAPAQQRLTTLLGDLIAAAAQAGDLRDDIVSSELASYCLHALAGARALPSKAAVHRLVGVTLAGLRPSGIGT